MKKNIALVLSSGGARGISHIGVIEEFIKQGFTITSIAGSSIGALIGGMYAMGRLADYADWVCSLNRTDVIGLIDLTLSSHGFLKGDRIFKKLESLIPDMLIEEMPIPFTALATDIINAKEVVFTEGSFYKAARASIAIPTIITSVQEKNRVLVDGGVLNPLPVNYVKRKPDDLLVAVNLYGEEDELITENIKLENIQQTEEDNQNGNFTFGINNSFQDLRRKFSEYFSNNNEKQNLGYVTILNTITSMMMQRIAKLAINESKPDIVINISKDFVRTFDFHKSTQIINEGREAAQKEIKKYIEKQYIISPYEKNDSLNTF